MRIICTLQSVWVRTLRMNTVRRRLVRFRSTSVQTQLYIILDLKKKISNGTLVTFKNSSVPSNLIYSTLPRRNYSTLS